MMGHQGQGVILKELLPFSYRPTLLRKIRETSAEPLISCQLVPQVAITMVAGVALKVSKGSTGVEFRYYKLPEFKIL